MGKEELQIGDGRLHHHFSSGLFTRGSTTTADEHHIILRFWIQTTTTWTGTMGTMVSSTSPICSPKSSIVFSGEFEVLFLRRSILLLHQSRSPTIGVVDSRERRGGNDDLHFINLPCTIDHQSAIPPTGVVDSRERKWFVQRIQSFSSVDFVEVSRFHPRQSHHHQSTPPPPPHRRRFHLHRSAAPPPPPPISLTKLTNLEPSSVGGRSKQTQNKNPKETKNIQSVVRCCCGGGGRFQIVGDGGEVLLRF